MLALLQDLTMSISLACPQQTLLKKPQTKPLVCCCECYPCLPCCL